MRSVEKVSVTSYMNEEQLMRRFRYAKIEEYETPMQFCARLERAFSQWFESDGPPKTYDNLYNFIIRDQYLKSFPSELRCKIKENWLKMVDDVADYADVWMTAHNYTARKSGSRSVQSNAHKPKKPQNARPVKRYEYRCQRCRSNEHSFRVCPQRY